jgi:hypothetical protein
MTMKSLNRWKFDIPMIALALSLVTTAGLAQNGTSAVAMPIQHTAVAAARPASPAKATAEATSERHPDEHGIKIHGHWKIDVKNADGSLASSKEFENSLADGGELLAYLLTGQTAMGSPLVYLASQQGFCGPTGFANNCELYVNGANVPGGCTAGDLYTSCSSNLAESVYTRNVGNGKVDYFIQLKGTIPATAGATITSVSTAFSNCYTPSSTLTDVSATQCQTPGTLPSDGSFGDPVVGATAAMGVFTAAATSVAVLAGQTIIVTVTLSFS